MSHPNMDESIQIDTSDDDSLFDTRSLVGSNLSFASSVRDYSYESGRRYHAYRNGQYPLPNDEEEQDRLALMHHLFKLLTGGDLHRAPIADTSPRRILDIGTGTGIWALEMAEDHPQADIIGTDLSPIQPNWAPPNCRFFIDDVESDWTFSPGEAFDYIHARSMGGGIGDWPRLLKQAYQHLKPGGWFEAQEFETLVVSDDGTHELATVLDDWQKLLNQASVKFGKPLNIAPRVSEWMTEQGFANVTDDTYKCPVGGWAKNRRLKEIGRIGKVTILEVVEPYTLALFTRVLGFTYQEAQEYMHKVRAELMSNSYHLYVYFHYVYGQRPFEDSPDSDAS
ncbi:hypothetical protein N7457_004370 [Penicillium paradoxum]|uniref:uncharacterized protein n=1 Tax=Penicillium paradoxum TaxID=176176 RepID=UPI00254906DF|nr:uncharacterized protein N7457_004370 [Penicillium paradoxum]KAJ5782596.1 hypothetical protein N7457_004370 [Penicillium paradoxum]